MTIYFAYGSNLNKDQMARRCPGARPLRRAVLRGWRLTFSGPATIERTGNAEDCVHGVLWELTPACERALDAYEGVAVGCYRRAWLRLRGQRVLTYIMNTDTRRAPGRAYIRTCIQGYDDFGLDTDAFMRAVHRVQHINLT